MNAKKNKSKKGFTIVELLVVLAIMGLLAIVTIPMILNAQKASRDAARREQLRSIQALATSLYTKTNSAVSIAVNASEVTLTSTSGGNTLTEKVTLANSYVLSVIPAPCSASDSTTIKALHDATNRKLTYCNEDGNAAEVLQY